MATLLLIGTRLVSAEPEPTAQKEDLLRPTMGFHLSYPLIASFSIGGVYPAGRDGSPAPFGVRGEAEIGIGGGIVSLGPEFRAGRNVSITASGAILRTWIATWGQPRNTTYTGGILKVDILGHSSMKCGVGYFRSSSKPTDSTILAFIGVGI